MCSPSIGKRIRNAFDVIHSAIVEQGGRVEVEPGRRDRGPRAAVIWYVAWRDAVPPDGGLVECVGNV